MVSNLNSKSPAIPVLTILFLISAGAAGYFYWQNTEAVKIQSSISARLSAAENEKNSMVTQLAEATGNVEELEQKISEMERSLTEAKTARDLAEAELQKAKSEVGGVQSHYEARIKELERDIKRYADFSAILAAEMKPIKEVLLGGQTPSASRSVRSSSEKPDGSGGSVTSVSLPGSINLVAGQVVAVNRDYGFVITSIGSSQGAEIGRVVQIYRKGEPMGLGRIERLKEGISAASMVSEDLIARVEKGDRVVLL